MKFSLAGSLSIAKSSWKNLIYKYLNIWQINSQNIKVALREAEKVEELETKERKKREKSKALTVQKKELEQKLKSVQDKRER